MAGPRKRLIPAGAAGPALGPASFSVLKPLRPGPTFEVEVVGATREVWIGEGLAAELAPLGLSAAALRVGGVEGLEQVTLYGGLVGVEQQASGALRPAAAWAVAAPAPMTTLLAQIDRHAPRPKADQPRTYPALPAELLELYDHCDGAVLFDRWDLLRAQDLNVVVGACEDGFYGRGPGSAQADGDLPSEVIPVVPFCTLKDDPRYFALHEGDEFQVVLVDPRRRQAVEALSVVEGGVQVVLTEIFANQGENWLSRLSGPSLYRHLPTYHTYLRAILSDPSCPLPTDVDRRELEQLIHRLCDDQGTREQRARWWAILEVATGTAETFDALFGRRLFRRRLTPFEIMQRLGLRPEG